MKKSAVLLIFLLVLCGAFLFSKVQGRSSSEQDKKDAPPAQTETVPMVALTFDDGPDPVYTDQILDILERYGAKATFFEIGEKLEDAPEALLREEALGCEVGSHSYSHQKFSKISGEEALADLEAADEAFAKVLGHSPTLVRPPYGVWPEELANTEYIGVKWSVDTADWQCLDANEIVSFVQGLGGLDGQVLLLHSLYESTVEAVEVLVPWLQEQGYELVTVSELIEQRFGETPTAGLYDAYFFWSALPSEPQPGTYSNFKQPPA